jgi:putative transcriptional regulator
VTIRLNLSEQMAARGWTPYKLAQELQRVAGLTEPVAYRWVRGEVKQIKLSTLDAVCQVLECQPGDILEYVKRKR